MSAAPEDLAAGVPLFQVDRLVPFAVAGENGYAAPAHAEEPVLLLNRGAHWSALVSCAIERVERATLFAEVLSEGGGRADSAAVGAAMYGMLSEVAQLLQHAAWPARTDT